MQLHTHETLNRPEAAAQRLRDLAREAMDDHNKNQAAAFAQWRDLVETDPSLMLGVLGFEWHRICQNYFNKAILSEPAKLLSAAANTPEAKAKHRQTSAKHRKDAAIATELGILEDMVINGKALRYCTRGELEGERGRLFTKWWFIDEVIKLLPTPDSKVGEVVTAAKANALYAAAKKQTAA